MNLLSKILSVFRPMNQYTVCFTCARGRAGNFRTVRARSAGEAQALVEATTPTLATVYKVLDYVRD